MRLHYSLMVTFAIVAALSLVMAVDFATRLDLFGVVFMLLYGLAAFGCANDQRRRAELLRIARHFERATGFRFPPILASRAVPPGEAHVVQDGKVVGRIVNLGGV